MLVHFFSAHLKKNGTDEFVKALREEVVPLLRTQKGFRAYDAFVISNGTEAAGISFWEKKDEDVETHLLRSNFQVTRVLARVSEGIPQIQSFEISDATFLAIEELRSKAEVIVRAPQLQIYTVPKATFDWITGCVPVSAVYESHALASGGPT